MKEEPRETVFVKFEMCKETSDNETECVHGKNDRLGDLIQEDKLYVNTFKEDVKPKMENTESQKEEDSIMKLINAEVMVEEEEYCDSPEYLSTKDFAECETREVKTEPFDNGASLSSVMLAHEDAHPGSSKESLKDCRQRVNETNEDTFQCQVCSKNCPTRFHLAKHVLICNRTIRFRCKFCSKSFIKLDNLVNHEKIHAGEKPYKCKVCPNSYAIRHLLVIHERIHTGEKPFNCKVCSRSFRVRHQLVTHQRFRHTEKDFHPGSSKESRKDFGSPQVDAKKKSGFQCNVCSKSFNRSSSLKRHQRIHTGEKPYICKICSKCFNDSSALRKHLMMHRREKTYPCKFCPKTFNQVDLLKQHRKMHVIYNCDVCSKSFKHVSNFRKHALVHTREKR